MRPIGARPRPGTGTVTNCDWRGVRSGPSAQQIVTRSVLSIETCTHCAADMLRVAPSEIGPAAWRTMVPGETSTT